MKFSLSWLFEHLETSASLEDISEALTRIGLEVEQIEDKSKTLSHFVVAQIVSAKPHPNADRLKLCTVDDGSGELIQVVCGAANARENLKSVFARAGTFIPGKNFTLGIGQIRGVESFGMLCSAEELGVCGDSTGIMELPADASIGQSYADYAGLSDPVIEINLTPNRADCAGIHGIARDLAAAGLGVFKNNPLLPLRATDPNPVTVLIKLDDPGLCPAFAWIVVRGIQNQRTDKSISQKLQGIGHNPINAAVDVTNFLTFDRGRPLHVFDAAKIRGDLVVRHALQDETFKALDGKTYSLNPSMVVIADDNGVQSLAGIIGGQDTGVDENTTDIIIESALWDPLNIARTGRALGIITDARYRFERGVDPDFCLPGLEQAARLITDICGGTSSQRGLAGDIPDHGRVIAFPWSEIKRLSGVEIPRPEAKAILQDLGFLLSGTGDLIRVSPPSWRADVGGKADLVEEVIRIAGLERVTPQPLPSLSGRGKSPSQTLLQRRSRLARRVLAARGLSEAMTWSFIAHDEAMLFGGGDASLRLSNPIASDLSDMRPSLLPGLLKAAQRNADRGFGDVALFEVGQCFISDEPNGQTMKAAGLRRNMAKLEGTGRHWQSAGEASQNRQVDVYDAKADIYAVLTALGVALGGVQILAGGPDFMHPGRSGLLQFGPRNIIGFFGELHPLILQKMGLKGVYSLFEVTLDALPSPKIKATKIKPKLVLNPLQPLARDFAFVMDKNSSAGDCVKAIEGVDRQLIADVSIFDVYKGPGLDDDKKSLALSVTLQPQDRSLGEADLEALSARIVAEVAKKTGAILRKYTPPA
jgi:phenylalanyl-tRNA synthetase beta chain